MATLASTIRLYDGATPAMRALSGQTANVIQQFRTLASQPGINTAALEQATREMLEIQQESNRIEAELAQANAQLDNFNAGAHRSQGSFRGILGVVGSIAAAIGGLAAGKQLIDLSDQMASNRARLSLIVDDGGSVEALDEKIFASAQNARSSYADTMATVSKLGMMAGDSFSNNDEMIYFANLMGKNFKIAGASAQEQQSAMYQLTQAMGSGRLQGDEYRSIIENAPLLAQSIEDYMRNVQGAVGSMKDWASEGLLTADVIKAAMFDSAGQVEERFESVPKTWADRWTQAQNLGVKALAPVTDKLNAMANDPRFDTFITGLVNGLGTIAGWLAQVAGGIMEIGYFFQDNWGIIAPILAGVAIALGGYVIVLGIAKAAAIASAAATAIKTVADIAATGATFAQTMAQHGLNTALLACPITWIILGIIALITIIYAVVGAINHFAGTTYSAGGIIMGALAVVGAFIVNLLSGLWDVVLSVVEVFWNGFAGIANFLGNVFNDPVGAIVRLFVGMADQVLAIIEGIARLIDKVFGSNLADSVVGWRDSMAQWATDNFGTGEVYVEKFDKSQLELGRIEYGDAWDAGYAFGEDLENQLAGLLGGDTAGYDPEDYYPPALDNIDASTAAMADNMDFAEEDLKYLRDLAEREAINRFTTAEIRVEVTNNNQIASDADVDGILERLADKVNESMASAAEGVYY